MRSYSPKQMAETFTPPVAVCFAVLAIGLTLAGCNETAAKTNDNASHTAEKRSQSSDWQVVRVTGRPYVETIQLPGASVHGFETTQVMAKVGGYVHEIGRIEEEEIDIGSLVSKDASLAVLDVPEMLDELAEKRALVAQAKSEVVQAEAAVKQAEADLKRRRAEVEQAMTLRHEKKALVDLRMTTYRRIQRLVQSKSIGGESLDEATYARAAAQSALLSVEAAIKTAEAQVLAAEANVVKAQADLRRAAAHVRVAEAVWAKVQTLAGFATIRAPFAGVITKRLVDHGAFVRPATSNSGAMPLFEITRTDRVRIVVSAPNTKTAWIHTGQKVLFHTIGGLPGVTIHGRVSRTAMALDQDSRMMRIEVHLSNPVEHAKTGKPIVLQPGMFGTLSVTLRRWEGENLLPVVPTAAVATDRFGQPYVIVVDSQGLSRRRPVEVAFDDASQVGLSDGVKIGDTVVIGDISKLAGGEKVGN